MSPNAEVMDDIDCSKWSLCVDQRVRVKQNLRPELGQVVTRPLFYSKMRNVEEARGGGRRGEDI